MLGGEPKLLLEGPAPDKGPRTEGKTDGQVGNTPHHRMMAPPSWTIRSDTKFNPLTCCSFGTSGQEPRPYLTWQPNPANNGAVVSIYHTPDASQVSLTPEEFERKVAGEAARQINHAGTRLRPDSAGTGVFTPFSTGEASRVLF